MMFTRLRCRKSTIATMSKYYKVYQIAQIKFTTSRLFKANVYNSETFKALLALGLMRFKIF